VTPESRISTRSNSELCDDPRHRRLEGIRQIDNTTCSWVVACLRRGIQCV
jgi:hypothetical protein